MFYDGICASTRNVPTTLRHTYEASANATTEIVMGDTGATQYPTEEPDTNTGQAGHLQAVKGRGHGQGQLAVAQDMIQRLDSTQPLPASQEIGATVHTRTSMRDEKQRKEVKHTASNKQKPSRRPERSFYTSRDNVNHARCHTVPSLPISCHTTFMHSPRLSLRTARVHNITNK